MDIKAIATMQGFDLLLNHVEEKVRRYALVGHADFENAALEALVAAENPNYESIGEFCLLEADIEAVYYDMQGTLTFTLPLPYETNLAKYIYGIALIGEHEGQNVVVSISKTPKIFKTEDIGGQFTYKVDITGEAGNIIYTSTLPYASAKEAEEGISMDKLITPATMAHVVKEVHAAMSNQSRNVVIQQSRNVVILNNFVLNFSISIVKFNLSI